MNEVQLLQARLHLVPPFTSRLASVPFDPDWPYWVANEHFDLGCASSADSCFTR
jgi:hypothetical protein